MITKGKKEDVLSSVESYLTENGFNCIATDFQRPWGGFFVIDEMQSEKFIKAFFPHLDIQHFSAFGKLSPKFLIVAPQTRLSWQYHHRRAEIWKLIAGAAKVAISESDIENPPKTLAIQQVINLVCGERHRLVGSEEEFGIVAEIWQHTDTNNPSNEDDIVRVQDDFGR
ncbi:MAG: phosphoheptose isomerase [Leadbetterella sp.]